MMAATKGAARSAVYDLQDAFFMPVSGFSTVIRPGPTVLIYRRRDRDPPKLLFEGGICNHPTPV